MNKKKINKKTGIGLGRFIKKLRDSVYAEAWEFLCIFNFFCSLRKKRMSGNTYGSANLRIRRIGNKFGKHSLTDILFINLYDYWTEFRNPQKRYLFWHSHIM